MSNIVDIIVADRNLATILRGIEAAHLETEWGKPGPFTVFAPTDLAFGKLREGDITELLKPENRIKLTGILNNLVAVGRNNFKDFADGQKLKTLNGKELLVHVSNGSVTVNGARVQARDMHADNGVVHSVDTVIMPVDE